MMPVSPELLHQLGHPPQSALRVIGVESLAQAVGNLLGFELQQHAVKQRQLLAVHAFDSLAQDRFELLRFDRHRGVAASHVGTIPRPSETDKTGGNERRRRKPPSHCRILSKHGNPTLATLQEISKPLGLRVSVALDNAG
jgi:hypothetical protein